MELERIEFVIPSLPESINSLYQIIFSQKKVELKPEVRLWKSMAKENIPLFSKKNVGFLRINVEYHANWFDAKGKVKRIDGANLDKMTHDAICERIGIDDKFVIEWSGKKVQSDRQMVKGSICLIEWETQ